MCLPVVALSVAAVGLSMVVDEDQVVEVVEDDVGCICAHN